MAVSKVVYGGNTLVDLTEDSVTSAALLSGYTAHNAAGEPVRGTATPGTTDYDDLSNKPQINGHTLTGNQTAADLGINEGTTNYNNLNNKPQIGGVELSGNKTLAQLGIPQPIVINNLITGQQTNLTKITISTSDPADDYVFDEGEIWLTYGDVTS